MARNTVMTSSRTRNSTATTGRRPSEYEVQGTSEFEGVWLNGGVWLSKADDDGNPIPGTERFARLNKGIALSDLLVQKVYENTDPDRAEDIVEINEIVEMLREAAPDLEEGEMVPVNLSFVMYRKQEGVEVAPKSTKDRTAAKKRLFGK